MKDMLVNTETSRGGEVSRRDRTVGRESKTGLKVDVDRLLASREMQRG